MLPSVLPRLGQSILLVDCAYGWLVVWLSEGSDVANTLCEELGWMNISDTWAIMKNDAINDAVVTIDGLLYFIELF
jgi:hypothetical protein